MAPLTNEEHEYQGFKLKYFDKVRELTQDFNNLSEDNKTRVMVELNKIIPSSFLTFEMVLKERLNNK